MEYRQIDLEDIKKIPGNTSHMINYFWQTIERNHKFKEYSHEKKIKTLVQGLSEKKMTLRVVFKKFPTLFMDVCDEMPNEDKDAHFLKDISIPLHRPFTNASMPSPSRSTTRPSFMTSMYQRFTRRRPASNASRRNASSNSSVTNEQYRNWYIKTSVDCIKREGEIDLLRFIDKSVLIDKRFAKEAFRKKIDIELTRDEIEKKDFKTYEDAIKDVKEIEVFLNNYITLLLQDIKSLRIASRTITGRKISNQLIGNFLVGNKTRKR